LFSLSLSPFPVLSSPFFLPLLPAVAQIQQDRKAEADRLLQQGIQHYQQGNSQAALVAFQRAIALFRQLGDRLGKGTTLNNIGEVYRSLGQYSRALEYYQQALTIARDIKHRSSQATALNNIGLIYASLRNYPRALEYAQQALAIFKDIGNRAGEGTTLSNIGTIYDSLGQYSRALEFYQQALAIHKAIGDRLGEGTTLNNLGEFYHSLGQYSKALEFYQHALVLLKDIGNRAGEGNTLNNIGGIYLSLGNYARALEFYQQALAIAKDIGDRSGEGTTLNNLGEVYRNLGQYPKALEYYQQALAIARDIGDRAGEGNRLNNIAEVYRSLGQSSRALEFYQQALAIRKAIGDRKGQATALNNIGNIYVNLNDSAKALESYQQALAIVKDIGYRTGEGTTLNNIGAIYYKLGNYPRALEYAQQALAILKAIGDRSGQGNTLANIGYLLEAQKQSELAIVFLKQSVSTYEAIREELRRLPKEQQQSYTETIAHAYHRLADILLQQDRVLEAQRVLDLLKVQELEGYLRNVRGDEKTLEYLQPEDAILQQYSELQKTSIEIGQELANLRKLDATNGLNPTQNQRLAKLEELERKINQQFNQFIESEAIQTLVEQLSRTASRQNLNLEDLNALRDDLKKLDAVLLYPLILDDRLELVITTPNSPPLRRTVKNLKREDLNRLIADYRSALGRRGSNAQELAQTLYTWLIQPLEADLKQARPKTILYAPDGPLRYIPLAALHDGKQWLIQRYRINNITARSVTDFHTAPPKQPRILAGAFGQVGTSVKVGDQEFHFNGLPAASKEVKTLVTAIPGTLGLLDQDFSRSSTLQRLNSFNIVHLATHGKFFGGRAEHSFILFGNHQRDIVTLDEVKDLTLNHVDLVVLSACETGLGGKLGNGEEILGLGYQFQRAGARATIASLWQVDDGGTQVLMNAFYAALKQGMSKAQALQETQKALITGDYTTVGGKRSDIEVVDSRTGGSRAVSIDTLNHPYYWAPFILIGNGL
jgi:CHAT domain-containing protein/tetratricopeptide (TPR) repeat protein